MGWRLCPGDRALLVDGDERLVEGAPADLVGLHRERLVDRQDELRLRPPRSVFSFARARCVTYTNVNDVNNPRTVSLCQRLWLTTRNSVQTSRSSTTTAVTSAYLRGLLRGCVDGRVVPDAHAVLRLALLAAAEAVVARDDLRLREGLRVPLHELADPAVLQHLGQFAMYFIEI